MPKPVVDESRCKVCGACVESCPMGLLQSTGKDTPPAPTGDAYCISCGHCVALCPADAIRHEDYPEGSTTPIARELLPATEQLAEMLRARRSARVFLPREIEHSLLERIIEAAHRAPSAHNSRSTQYIVVQNSEMIAQVIEQTAVFFRRIAKLLNNPVARTLYGWLKKDELRAALPMLPDMEMLAELHAQGQDMVLRGAPCLILFHGDPGLPMAGRNAQLALHNATLLAETLGLASFYTGFVIAACEKSRAIPKLLGVPRGHQVYAGMAVGYPKYSFRKWVDRAPAEVRWL